MKVVVYHPHYDVQHCTVLRALADGINCDYRDAREYIPCDVAVIFGGYKYANKLTTPKRDILKRHQGRKLVMVEAALQNRGKYWQVGIGGAAGHAEFGPGRIDRLAGMGITPKPWKPGGEYVLVIGQLPRDVQVQDTDHRGWCREVVKHYEKKGVPVRFRPHPMVTNPAEYGVPDRLIDRLPLAESLARARCAVTWNSTAGTDAALAGVPVVAMDPGSFAYPVASHDLDTLRRPDRSEWLGQLGAAQWALNEMRSGETWAHLCETL